MGEQIDILTDESIGLLKKLISIPSFSKEEDKTAEAIFSFLDSHQANPYRIGNNVFALSKNFDPEKPVVLLNSHHDTVKPNKGYTLNPFDPLEKDSKLFGLGSNDAGGALVSLIAAFLFYSAKEDLKYNLVIATTAEEEISGKDGIEMLLKNEEFLKLTHNNNNQLFKGWTAIVGEPTLLQMAIAERGLMVLDCIANGVAGHAAREEGENSIYIAIKDINWFQSYKFDKVSDLLGPVKMSVTVIETDNKAHNVVPAQCKYVVDVRVNELYGFQEVLDTIGKNVKSEVVPRSTRLRSTSISLDHPLVKAGIKLGKSYYGSPTTSDKALMPFPALKIGPGDSARSHSANEYIFVDEIRDGVSTYIRLLEKILL